MKKMLLVLCVIAFASLTASATTGYTVTFNGYVDSMSIANYSGIIFGGTHWNANGAGLNTHGGGFIHGAPGYTVYTGAAFDFGDPLFGLGGSNSSLQYLLQVAGSVKHPVKCGWVIYYGPDGVSNYYLNSGYCTLVSRPLGHQQSGKVTTSR